MHHNFSRSHHGTNDYATSRSGNSTPVQNFYNYYDDNDDSNGFDTQFYEHVQPRTFKQSQRDNNGEDRNTADEAMERIKRGYDYLERPDVDSQQVYDMGPPPGFLGTSLNEQSKAKWDEENIPVDNNHNQAYENQFSNEHLHKPDIYSNVHECDRRSSKDDFQDALDDLDLPSVSSKNSLYISARCSPSSQYSENTSHRNRIQETESRNNKQRNVIFMCIKCLNLF